MFLNMRTIRIITVGKIKQAFRFLSEGIALYEQRLSRHFKVEWIEVPEATGSTREPVEAILSREADLILKHCWPDVPLIVLGESGQLMDSLHFSTWLLDHGNPLNGGRGVGDWTRIIFIIGGAYGTSGRLVEKAHTVLSLSRLTFPHQLVRLIFMEQLYRAVTLYHNEPYHK